MDGKPEIAFAGKNPMLEKSTLIKCDSGQKGTGKKPALSPEKTTHHQFLSVVNDMMYVVDLTGLWLCEGAEIRVAKWDR
mgnify:CR=1 FL=1